MRILPVFVLLFATLAANAQEVDSYMDSEYKKYTDSLLFEGEFDKAIQYLTELAKDYPLTPGLYCHLGVLKDSYHPNDKSSISDIKRAISIDSNYIIAHWHLGIIYMELVYGQDYFNKVDYLENDSSYMTFNEYYLDSAINCYEKVLEIDSGWLYTVRSSLYDLYLSKGEKSKAITIKGSDYQAHVETDSLNVPINSSIYYYPIDFLIDTINRYYGHTVLDNGFIIRRTDLAHWVNNSYSSILFGFKEPILYNDFYKYDVYRFTWLRSFHEPIVIRIENNENSIQVFVKMTDGVGRYQSGELIINDTIMINENQWLELTNKIDGIDFWNINPIEDTHGAMGEDGAHWILEGLKDGQYHMIDRWSGKEKETGEPCLYILKLSGMEVDRIY